ncbi:hypothetical protein DFH09DRAFT_1311468 [Mycena vulgaris]|nr:hypothetical protein DFH09DRAFT_1311468 [Mycena vulgaris]
MHSSRVPSYDGNVAAAPPSLTAAGACFSSGRRRMTVTPPPPVEPEQLRVRVFTRALSIDCDSTAAPPSLNGRGPAEPEWPRVCVLIRAPSIDGDAAAAPPSLNGRGCLFFHRAPSIDGDAAATLAEPERSRAAPPSLNGRGCVFPFRSRPMTVMPPKPPPSLNGPGRVYFIRPPSNDRNAAATFAEPERPRVHPFPPGVIDHFDAAAASATPEGPRGCFFCLFCTDTVEHGGAAAVPVAPEWLRVYFHAHVDAVLSDTVTTQPLTTSERSRASSILQTPLSMMIPPQPPQA